MLLGLGRFLEEINGQIALHMFRKEASELVWLHPEQVMSD